MSRFPNCTASGCESVASWQPVVLVWNVGENVHEDKPTRIKMQAYICAMDKPKMTVGDLVSDHGFEKICKVFKIFGRGKPDRDTMKLDWVTIEGKRS